MDICSECMEYVVRCLIRRLCNYVGNYAGMLQAGGQERHTPPQILAEQKAPHYYLTPQIFRPCNIPVYVFRISFVQSFRPNYSNQGPSIYCISGLLLTPLCIHKCRAKSILSKNCLFLNPLLPYLLTSDYSQVPILHTDLINVSTHIFQINQYVYL